MKEKRPTSFTYADLISELDGEAKKKGAGSAQAGSGPYDISLDLVDFIKKQAEEDAKKAAFQELDRMAEEGRAMMAKSAASAQNDAPFFGGGLPQTAKERYDTRPKPTSDDPLGMIKDYENRNAAKEIYPAQKLSHTYVPTTGMTVGKANGITELAAPKVGGVEKFGATLGRIGMSGAEGVEMGLAEQLDAMTASAAGISNVLNVGQTKEKADAEAEAKARAEQNKEAFAKYGIETVEDFSKHLKNGAQLYFAYGDSGVYVDLFGNVKTVSELEDADLYDYALYVSTEKSKADLGKYDDVGLLKLDAASLLESAKKLIEGYRKNAMIHLDESGMLPILTDEEGTFGKYVTDLYNEGYQSTLLTGDQISDYVQGKVDTRKKEYADKYGEMGAFGSFLSDGAFSMGRMAPSMAVGALATAFGDAFGASAALAKALGQIGSGIYNASTSNMSGQKNAIIKMYYENAEAVAAGRDPIYTEDEIRDNAAKLGFGNAIIDSVGESLFGGLLGRGAGILDSMFAKLLYKAGVKGANPILSAAVSFLGKGLGEMFEEIGQGSVSHGMENAVLDKADAMEWNELLYEGAVAFFMGSVSNIPDFVLDTKMGIDAVNGIKDYAKQATKAKGNALATAELAIEMEMVKYATEQQIAQLAQMKGEQAEKALSILKWQRDSLDGILGKMDAKAAFETVAQNNTAAPVETEAAADLRGGVRALMKDEGGVRAVPGNGAEVIADDAGAVLREDTADEAASFDDAELDGAQYSVSRTVDGRGVAVLDDDILADIDTTNWTKEKKEAAQKAASNALKQFQGGLLVHGINAKVNKISRDEYTRSTESMKLYRKNREVFADKMRAADIADDIVTVTTGWQRDGGLKYERDDFVDFEHGVALISARGNKYEVTVVVGIRENGEYVFYDVVGIKPTNFQIEKTEPSSAATPQNAFGAIYDGSADSIVAQNGKIVKGNSKIFSRKPKSTPVPVNATAASLGLIDDETFRTGRAFGADVETIRFAQEVAAATNIPVTFFHTPEKDGYIRNGYYYQGEIHINTASQNPRAQILAHELTHSIEGTEAYAQLYDLVLGRIKGEGRNLEAMIREKELVYLEAEVRLRSRAEAEAEVVAEYVEKNLLTDRDSVLSLVQQDRTLGQKIKDFFEALIDRIAEIFGGASVKAEHDFIRQARDLYAEALGQRMVDMDAEAKSSVSRVNENAAAQDDGVDISIPGDADAPPAWSGQRAGSGDFGDILSHGSISSERTVADRERAYVEGRKYELSREYIAKEKTANEKKDAVAKKAETRRRLTDERMRTDANAALGVLGNFAEKGYFKGTSTLAEHEGALLNMDSPEYQKAHKQEIKYARAIARRAKAEIDGDLWATYSTSNAAEKAELRKIHPELANYFEAEEAAKKARGLGVFKNERAKYAFELSSIVERAEGVDGYNSVLEYLRGAMADTEKRMDAAKSDRARKSEQKLLHDLGATLEKLSALAEDYTLSIANADRQLTQAYASIDRELGLDRVVKAYSSYDRRGILNRAGLPLDATPDEIAAKVDEIRARAEGKYLEKARAQNAHATAEGTSQDGVNVGQLVKNYNKAVDDVLTVSDETAKYLDANGSFVEISQKTPKIILDRIKGARDLPLLMPYKKLYAAVRKNGILNEHYHNLGTEIAKRLPAILEHPDAIIKHKNGNYNLFSTIKTEKGNNFIISLALDSPKNIDNHFDYYNVVVTMFSADDQYVQNTISKYGEKVIYKREDMSQVNPQLLKWLEIINDKSSPGNSIAQKAGVVNSDDADILTLQEDWRKEAAPTEEELLAMMSEEERALYELNEQEMAAFDEEHAARMQAAYDSLPSDMDDSVRREDAFKLLQRENRIKAAKDIDAARFEELVSQGMDEEQAAVIIKNEQAKREREAKKNGTGMKKLGIEIAGAITDEYQEAAAVISSMKEADRIKKSIDKYAEQFEVSGRALEIARDFAHGRISFEDAMAYYGGMKGKGDQHLTTLAEMYKQLDAAQSVSTQTQRQKIGRILGDQFEAIVGDNDLERLFERGRKGGNSLMLLNSLLPESVPIYAFGDNEVGRAMRDTYITPVIQNSAAKDEKLMSIAKMLDGLHLSNAQSALLQIVVECEGALEDSKLHLDRDMIMRILRGELTAETVINDVAGKVVPKEYADAAKRAEKRLEAIEEKIETYQSEIDNLTQQAEDLKVKGKDALAEQKLDMVKRVQAQMTAAKADRVALMEQHGEFQSRHYGLYDLRLALEEITRAIEKEAKKAAKKHAGAAKWGSMSEDARAAAVKKERANIADVYMAKVNDAAPKVKELLNNLYDAINEVYVMHGKAPIPFRKNYMPHSQPDDVMTKLGELARFVGLEPVSDLPSTIAGLTQNFKPNAKFFAHALERKTDVTVYDATGNIFIYANAALDTIYHMDDIMRSKDLETRLRAYHNDKKAYAEQVRAYLYEYGTSEEDLEKRAELSEAMRGDGTTLSSYCIWLHNYWNDLAGKQILARDQEQSANRQSLNALAKYIRMSSRSQLGLNIGSAIKQFSQLPMVIAENGLFKSLHSIGRAFRKNNTLEDLYHLSERSTALAEVERFREKLHSDDHISFDDVIFWPSSIMSALMTRSAYYANFQKALDSGLDVDVAIEWADRNTRKKMSSRMKGAQPLNYASKSFFRRVLTMFQREVFAAWEWLVDTKASVKEFRDLIEEKVRREHPEYSEAEVKRIAKKRASDGVAKRMVSYQFAAHTVNTLCELMGLGSPVLFDVGSYLAGDCFAELIRGVFDNIGEDEEDKKELREIWENASKELGIHWDQILGDVPVLGNLMTMFGINELFGFEDNGRLPLALPDVVGGIRSFKEGDIIGGALDIFKPFLPIGTQANKTYEGLSTMFKGGSKREDGRYNFMVDQNNIGEWIRAISFGKYATDGGQEYIDNDFKAYSKDASTAYDALTMLGVESDKAKEIVKNVSSAKGDDVFAMLGLSEDNFTKEDAEKIAEARGVEPRSKAQVQTEIIEKLSLTPTQRAALYRDMVATDKQKEAIVDAMGVKSSNLADVVSASIELRESEKKAEKVNALAGADIEEGQKKALYQKMIGDSDDEEILAFEKAGLSFDDFLSSYIKKQEIAEDDDLSADQRAARLYVWAEERGMTDDQINVVLENRGYKNGAETFEKYLDTGLSSDEALTAMDALKGTKKNAQRLTAVMQAELSDQDRLKALSVVLSESLYERIVKGIDDGLTLSVFERYYRTVDTDDNGSVSNAERTYAIQTIVFERDERSAMWIATGGKEGSDPWGAGAQKSGNGIVNIEIPKIEIDIWGGK